MNIIEMGKAAKHDAAYERYMQDTVFDWDIPIAPGDLKGLWKERLIHWAYRYAFAHFASYTYYYLRRDTSGYRGRALLRELGEE